jgi:hypothetical protein
VTSAARTYIRGMVKIAISQAAFDAIASTMPLGSAGFENMAGHVSLRRLHGQESIRRSRGELGP